MNDNYCDGANNKNRCLVLFLFALCHKDRYLINISLQKNKQFFEDTTLNVTIHKILWLAKCSDNLNP